MKSFEAPGVFWLPSAPERRIAGKLAAGKDGITLTVHDSLQPIEMSAGQVVDVAPRRVAEATVFGRLTDREADVTLLDVAGSSIVIPFGEVTESFDVSMALVGGHVASRITSRLSIEFDLLRDWVVGVGGPVLNQTELRLDVGPHVLHEAEVNRHHVAIVQRASTSFGPSVVIRRRTTAEVSGSDLSIDSIFMDWLRPLHDLLIVALGRAVAVTELHATMEVTNGAKVDLEVFMTLLQPEAAVARKSLDLRGDDALTLLVPDDPSIDFGALLPAWFRLREELLDTVVQLCAPFYAMFIYSEHLYGSVFQSAEALAKSRFASKQRRKAEHTARVSTIIDAARRAGVGDEDLQWASNVLRSRNDRPLRELIAELLEDSDAVEASQGAVLAPEMATARTGVSHGGAAGADADLRYRLGQVLQWVIRARLLRELGVPADIMSERLRSKTAFQRSLQMALDRLNSHEE